MIGANAIIQQMRDSEMNGSISWSFDGLWVCRLEGTWGDWKLESKADDFESAIRDLAEKAFGQFPQSRFAQWWAIAKNG